MGQIEYISPNTDNSQDTPKSEEAALAIADWKKESDDGSFLSVLSSNNSETSRKDLIKLGLIIIFALILLIAAIYGLADNFAKNAQLHIIKKSDSEMSVKKGKTEASFQIGQPFEEEYRVYDIVPNVNKDPLNFFDAVFVALPLSQARAIFENDGSEIDARLKARRIPVIAASEEIKNRIENYAKYKSEYSSLTLSIKGNLLKRKEVYYKNKPAFIDPRDFDDQEYLLINNLAEISWQSEENDASYSE